MKVGADCQCLICSTPSSQSVELVRETFTASRTLEKTLKMLCGRISDSKKVDTKRVFEEMTWESGGWFCFPCLAVLHAGLGLVSEIMQLEERLFNLIRKINVDTVDGAMIPYNEANISQDQQSNRNSNSCYTDDIPSRKRTQKPHLAGQSRDTILKGRPKREIDSTDGETGEKKDEESQESVNGLRKSTKKQIHRQSKCAEEEWKSTKPQSIKKKPLKKESANSVPLKSKSRPKTRKCTTISGVKECPSCDYTVDVRSPEQAAKSSESLTASARALLGVKSRYKLAIHFREVHLGVSAIKRFRLNKSIQGASFKCTECPYVALELNKVLIHYISIHVRERPKPVSTGCFNLSCPEKGCSFVAVAVKPGCRWVNTSDLQMRNTLSSHVIRHHDRNSLSAEKFQVSSRLLVKNKYQCTRCEYTITPPETTEKLSRGQRESYCKIFLRHFFDVHLRDLISNPTSNVGDEAEDNGVCE